MGRKTNVQLRPFVVSAVALAQVVVLAGTSYALYDDLDEMRRREERGVPGNISWMLGSVTDAIVSSGVVSSCLV